MIDRIQRVLRDYAPLYLKRKGKKPLTVQAREMLALYRAYNYLPYHYLKHSMYLRSFSADPLDFLPPEIVDRYSDDLNPRKSWDLVHDKKRFFQLMKAGDFPIIPNLFSISSDGTIKSADEEEVGFDDMLLVLPRESCRTGCRRHGGSARASPRRPRPSRRTPSSPARSGTRAA